MKRPGRLRVVLVRPRDPNNIGACARAMANFGFSDLVVVDPYAPVWRETRSAPGAEGLVRRARKVSSVRAAIRGCPIVLGTSSFHQRTLQQAIVTLPQLTTYLERFSPGSRIALLFGSERSGLSNEELAQCQAVVRIPTVARTPSMNLAQAVATVLYELSSGGRRGAARRPSRAGAVETESVVRSWIELAEAAGYPPGYTAAARAGRIRWAMQHAELPPATVRFLESFSRWLKKKLS